MSGAPSGPLALLPELCLLLGAVAALLTAAFSPRTRQWPATAVAAVALLTTVGTGTAAGSPGTDVFDGTFRIDAATHGARVVVPLLALLTLGVARDRIRHHRREGEFAVLVLLAGLGALVLAGAVDLLVLAVGYLLASIPLYALAGWARDAKGTEAAMKLFLLGALLGIGMLLGIAVLVGASGGRTTYAELAQGLGAAPRAAVALGLVAVLGGLLFKTGAVPAQFWVPDAAEGATAPAAAFLTTVPKVGGLLAAYRFVGLVGAVPENVVSLDVLVAVLAALTMTWGNLAAFGQTSPSRLLGWSTVSQAGYLLMAVAVADPTAGGPLTALLLYLAAYGITTIGAFAVVAALPGLGHLQGYRGLARSRPALAGVLVVCLLGLVGTPPTAVFVGKLTVFTAAWDGGLAWLVGVAAVNTVASLYYYLRWLSPVFQPDRPAGRGNGPPQGGGARPRPWPARVAVVAGAAALGLGVSAGAIMAFLSTAAVRP